MFCFANIICRIAFGIVVNARNLKPPFSGGFKNKLLPYFAEGKKGRSVAATPLIGMVCSQICPGPRTTVLKIPSPPNSIFLIPGTDLISIVQLSVMAAI